MDRTSLFALCCVFASALTTMGCSDAFKSAGKRGDSAVSVIEFDGLFGDGTPATSVREDGSVRLVITLPTVGFSQVVDAGGTVDPTRLFLRATPDPIGSGGTNLVPSLQAATLIAPRTLDGGAIELDVDIPAQGPWTLPVGLVVLELQALDDIDRETDAVTLELTVVAADRPTATLRLEVPPVNDAPSGRRLPVDSQGRSFIGESLPFVVVVEARPNPDSSARFERLLTPNGINPERLIVVADRDLGNQLAGENLALQFGTVLPPIVEPDGSVVLAWSIARDDGLAPPLDSTTFTAFVLDDDDTESPTTEASLHVQPEIPLVRDVQPIFDNHCAFFGCHGADYPVFDLDLSTPSRTWMNLAGVFAEEPADGSCSPLRVEPYAPETSYLVFKMLGAHIDSCAQGNGDVMPPGDPLDDNTVATLAAWIAQGAHE